MTKLSRKMKVKRDFLEWLAEFLPEYQHEDKTALGNNIHECLETSAQSFIVIFKSVAGRKTQITSKTPKRLVKAYFHNLIRVKITPDRDR